MRGHSRYLGRKKIARRLFVASRIEPLQRIEIATNKRGQRIRIVLCPASPRRSRYALIARKNFGRVLQNAKAGFLPDQVERGDQKCARMFSGLERLEALQRASGPLKQHVIVTQTVMRQHLPEDEGKTRCECID